MNVYEALPDGERWAPEQEIQLRLRITNGSAAAIEAPDPSVRGTQPVFTVRGPGFEKVFSTDSLLKNPFEQKPPPQPRIRVNPGQTWEGTVALRGFAIAAPGEYQVSSRLENSGGEWTSEPQTFRVSPALPSDVDLGFGIPPEGKGEGEIAFLHRTDGGALLYSAVWVELRPDIGDTSLNPPVLRAALGPDAREVGVPRKNAPFRGEVKRWVVWREGAAVHALSSADENLAVALPAEPRALVRPALKEAGGPLDVLTLAADAKQLQLVRFDGSAGKVAWVSPLPAEAENAVAALGPEKKGSPRHVAFATHTEQGIAIFHSRFARDSKPEAFTSVRFEPRYAGVKLRPPPRLLPGSSADLQVDGKGSAVAGFLATDGEDVWLLEARFAEGFFRPDLDVEATRLGPIDGVPTGGAVLYVSGKDGGIVRREVVLRLHDGGLARLKNGTLQSVSVQGPATAPIVLAPGRAFTYILFANPARGIYLEPI